MTSALEASGPKKYFFAFSILLDGLAHISAIFLLKMKKKSKIGSPYCTWHAFSVELFCSDNCISILFCSKHKRSKSKSNAEKAAADSLPQRTFRYSSSIETPNIGGGGGGGVFHHSSAESGVRPLFRYTRLT
jgi:hypothetical protein